MFNDNIVTNIKIILFFCKRLLKNNLILLSGYFIYKISMALFKGTIGHLFPILIGTSIFFFTSSFLFTIIMFFLFNRDEFIIYSNNGFTKIKLVLFSFAIYLLLGIIFLLMITQIENLL